MHFVQTLLLPCSSPPVENEQRACATVHFSYQFILSHRHTLYRKWQINLQTGTLFIFSVTKKFSRSTTSLSSMND
jgi:hypothetical protein